MSERAFLDTILADPGDNDARLIYADWLEENGDADSVAKAEFLRVSVQAANASLKKREYKRLEKRLQSLAASLDTDWLAVVSRLAIESCQGKQIEAQSRGGTRLLVFSYLCDRRWEDLAATDDHAVRFCDGCQHNVYYCDTIMQAREHAVERHCVAVDLGVIRREDDLHPRRSWMGRMSPETLEREERRIQPDRVSAQREQQKRAILRETN